MVIFPMPLMAMTMIMPMMDTNVAIDLSGNKQEMVRTIGKPMNAIGDVRRVMRCKWTAPRRRCRIGNMILCTTSATTPFELSVIPDPQISIRITPKFLQPVLVYKTTLTDLIQT